jgi:ubiquinone/menaquinone biosynthesis C-methylase UbiE
MAWYDFFSRFYDASLEPHYREQRVLAAQALDVRPDSVILDLPCGTGQSFPHFAACARLWGVDLSAGMLRQAQRRVDAAGWQHVRLLAADATTLAPDALDRRPDRLHVFLGMSVFPDPRAVFQNLWSLLAPGGKCVIVDVHTDALTFQGRMVNWMARADIRRKFWEPLEEVGQGYSRTELPSKALHGGKIWLAAAHKPR